MACSSACLYYPGTSGAGRNRTAFLSRLGPAGILLTGHQLVLAQLRCRRAIVRSDLASNVSDMRTNGEVLPPMLVCNYFVIP